LNWKRKTARICTVVESLSCKTNCYSPKEPKTNQMEHKTNKWCSRSTSSARPMPS